MKHSTKDLYKKYLSGYTLDEISQDTGIGKWALYKRFERMKKAESSSENNSKCDETPENIISIPDESQTKTGKRSDAVYALLILVIIVTGFFLYRKYYSEKPHKETK